MIGPAAWTTVATRFMARCPDWRLSPYAEHAGLTLDRIADEVIAGRLEQRLSPNGKLDVLQVRAS